MTTPADSPPSSFAPQPPPDDEHGKAAGDAAWYQLLFERNPAPMWVFDLETLRFLAVNDAAVRAYGYTREEFLARLRITDIRPNEDIPLVLTRLAARPRGLSHPATFRHLTRTGELRWVSVTSTDVAHDGRPARLVLALDVTEAEQARAALARSEAQLAEAQHVARMGSWEWDLAGDVVRCSAEMLRLCGLEPRSEPLTRERFLELVHLDDRAMMRVALERARAGEQPLSLLHRVVRPGGRVARFQAQGELISSDDGAPLRVVGTAQDVTERLETEARMRLAEKAEAVGRLAAGIAHDFNNLLTAIRGTAELLGESLPADDEAAQRDVRDIVGATERAAKLTQQLLAFGRQQVLAPRVLDLNALITDFATILERALPEQIEQVLALDPKLGRVRADRDQLEQVLLNLAMNARDAMPDGGVMLIHTADVTLDERFLVDRPQFAFTPGPYVKLSVSDTGVGIDGPTRDRIFEPFFTTKGRALATGLGLSTVYGIVKQSGGYVWVESQPGRGTRFDVYLPRVEAEAEPAAATTATTAARRGTETVLVVEDEPLILDLATRVLRANGYTVLAALRGDEAAALAEGHDGPLHLLLTDVVMPQLSGPALAERIAAKRPALRVLFMSGYSEGDIVQHRVLQRGVHLLEKPFTPRQLLERVRAVLDGKGE